jgi:hypothetical protein
LQDIVGVSCPQVYLSGLPDVKPSACFVLLDRLPQSGMAKALMDNAEIRRENLRALKTELGSEKVLNLTGWQKQQLSAYIGKNPTRNIGDQAARDIERAFRKPRGWMDHLHGEPAKDLQEIIDFARALDPAQRKSLLQFVKAASNFALAPREDGESSSKPTDEQ